MTSVTSGSLPRTKLALMLVTLVGLPRMKRCRRSDRSVSCSVGRAHPQQHPAGHPSGFGDVGVPLALDLSRISSWWRSYHRSSAGREKLAASFAAVRVVTALQQRRRRTCHCSRRETQRRGLGEGVGAVAASFFERHERRTSSRRRRGSIPPYCTAGREISAFLRVGKRRGEPESDSPVVSPLPAPSWAVQSASSTLVTQFRPSLDRSGRPSRT